MNRRHTPTGMPRSDRPASRRVLLADDDANLRAALSRVLSAAGFEVTRAEDGNAAVQALKQDSFDVIITDINMPGSSGVDLLRLVRAYDLDVPVVLMTAAPDIETAIEATELGALRYLRKPIDNEELTKAVERACRLRRLAHMKRQALAVLGQPAEAPGDRAGVMAAFDQALETMWLAFQPIVHVGHRQVLAYEALVRSDSTKLPQPEALLSAAERVGRLQELGRRVRELVARQMPSVPNDAWVFLNLHPRDLLDPTLSSDADPLAPFAHRVVLEITERAALDEVADIERRLSILRFMGYRVAVDDLGAGYAGLTSFARLEPEFVKLDMSLVRGLETSTVRQKLIGSMVSLCGELGMSMIAEGVEKRAELNELRRLGCELVQGYLFARPARGFPNVSW